MDTHSTPSARVEQLNRNARHYESMKEQASIAGHRSLRHPYVVHRSICGGNIVLCGLEHVPVRCMGYLKARMSHASTSAHTTRKCFCKSGTSEEAHTLTLLGQAETACASLSQSGASNDLWTSNYAIQSSDSSLFPRNPWSTSLVVTTL